MEQKLTIKIPKDNYLTEYISSNESTPPPPPPSSDEESPIISRPPLDDSLFDLSDDSVYNDISNAQDNMNQNNMNQYNMNQDNMNQYNMNQTNQESPYGFELSAPTLITSDHIVSEYIQNKEYIENKENNCSCCDSIICSITGLIIFIPIIIIVLPFYSVYRVLKLIF
jgi:hypothetical protein